MKKSIGAKITAMLVYLGIILFLACALNMSALSYIRGFDNDIQKATTDIQQLVQNGEAENIVQAEEELGRAIRSITVRIEGTYTFDIILMIFILINI